MDSTAATQKLQTLRTLMTGHTDRNEEKQILGLFANATAAELNYLITNINVDALLSDVDNRLVGPDHLTTLLETLCVQRAHELGLPVRAGLMFALQTGLTPQLAERMIQALFLSTRGRELTEFKNLLDGRGTYRDLQQLVFSDVDSPSIRQEILDHIRREAETAPSGENKVLSDIDDTFILNWKDTRYPPKTVYPGVLQFYRELDRGPGIIPGREGDLTFVSARPMDPLGFIEDRTLATLREHGVPTAAMLSGAFTHLLGNSRIAEKKFDNFSRYVQLYPEYGFVFVGDSGQGDVAFGEQMLASHPETVRAVFIHDVVDTPELVRKAWRDKRIFFFDTYVGAAVEAYQVGVIARDGVQRVVRTTREELEKVNFGSAEQREARRADLSRDLQRADALR
ncbi:phosphatase domain-containing protein [Hyalangium rubrum]|uniref:Phosphatase domain-containing protein n=1 Tax=Hyalangium rubrum TaxID=3103134 RepID=A0ABU5HEG2_9BACT|nr:phosphatase domain-containing protein [Hyalangium sp. s54d21]MDY7231646.1 phosphatase domain-containing protein [Hyalangium sp. s54d21]